MLSLFIFLFHITLYHFSYQEDISLPYPLTHLVTSSSSEALFRVTFPEQYKYIKISTTSAKLTQVVNFYISYENKAPSYTKSDFRTHSVGPNIFFLSYYTSQYFYLRIASMEPTTEYSLQIDIVTEDYPSIDQEEYLNTDLNFIKKLNINYTPYIPDKTQRKHLLIYAIGYSLDDFKIEIRHVCKDKEDTEETIFNGFYNGYACQID